MSLITSPTIASRNEAEQIAQTLVNRGIPVSGISIREGHEDLGISLGNGVSADAVNAVIAEHEGSIGDGFVIQVDDRGDLLNEIACKEVFGYLA